MYNLASPKYDSLLAEYRTYPTEMRNQKLRDSLFVKYNMPEEKGNNLFINRNLHNLGTPPVILDQEKTKSSAASIRKRLVYRGYWDAETQYAHELDSATKKAQVHYTIIPNTPTIIDGYYYHISDPNIKRIYEQSLEKSEILSGQILDQTKLEAEVKRINEQMKAHGYYQFNATNQEVFFTADTLQSRKKVPLILEIHKDSARGSYKVSTIGKIEVAILDDAQDFKTRTTEQKYRGIHFHKTDERYKTSAIWRAILVAPDKRYDQKHLDNTRRNILSMNNFSLIKAEDKLREGENGPANDSIVDVQYLLKPLPKFDLKIAGDVNYSELLNLGITPSVNLTTRNIFKGAENLTTSLSWMTGTVQNSKNPGTRIWAHEFSTNATLHFPRLLMPFSTYRLIPKRFTPTTIFNLGASLQRNIGMNRVNFNAGLTYNATVNDIVSHRLSLFNAQFSLTGNKEAYYEYFPLDAQYRDLVFAHYSPTHYQNYLNGTLSHDEYSNMIIKDEHYPSTLSQTELDNYNSFRQSISNKDRQTQDVIISSLIYNFTYNEIGKKEFNHPVFFNGKLEIAGNLLGLLTNNFAEKGITTGEQKTLFGIPYSQFIKMDADVRKYFNIGRQTLALRQLIGVGLPYGNSNAMPFVRSYFNGGSNDIRAWRPFGGLGPADSQLDEKVRTFSMGNIKLTTSIEYRIPINDMYETAIFTDAGNIWNLNNNLGDGFKFNRFYKQLGVGSGIGLRIHVAYITVRVDLAYKIYDPNQPAGKKWQFNQFNPLKPTLNLAFGYPF